MYRLLKIIALLLTVIGAIIGILYLFIHLAFGGVFTGPTYSKQDLIDNFEQKKTEIMNIKKFVDSKTQIDTYFHIEFENEGLGIFHIEKNGIFESNWDVNIDSKKADLLLNEIGWTKKDLEILKYKLDNANCISVSSGDPTTIGWQRSGMGMYFYNIFDQNLSDSLIAEYNDGCTHLYYKDNVVLEYGGGAIGSQCFPDYVRK